MVRPSEAGSPRVLAMALLAGLTVITALKLFLATRLELYSDEIFYWQASTRPALAYSDLPFMTSLLAGLGTMLGGQNPAGVRSLFLVLGSLLPLLLYWVARPLTGRRQALETALLGLCLPLSAFMGLLAVPDVALVFFGVLLIGLFERATRLDRTELWLGVGLVTALGLSTHYRFILYPAAMLGFLLLSTRHHYLWRTPRLWVSAAIALSGLYPTIAFNLQNDFSGLSYHFVERHPWQFQTEGLLHPLMQATVVTPLMYAALITTLILLLHHARRGDERKGLFAAFALVHLGIFMLLAPWADGTRTTFHWPLSGYLPLLVYAPWGLREIGTRLSRRMSRVAVRRALLSVPLTGLLGVFIALAGIGSQGFNEQLRGMVGRDVLSNKMAGWQEMNRHLQTLMRNPDADTDTMVVTDNYYAGAQVAFYTDPAGGVFNIDRDKAVRDGRLAQYTLWGMSEAGLVEQPGAPLTFITEDSTLNINEKLAVMERACALFDGLSLVDRQTLYGGDKQFSFYQGRVSGNPDKRSPGGNCPLPSYLWLDDPGDGQIVSGAVLIRGWAFNEGAGIERIHLRIDGEQHASIERHVSREDVVEAMEVESDPAMPRLGFEYRLDSRALRDGSHTLALEVLSRDGERQTFARREIVVRNTAPPGSR